jgi:hypothetical protein
MPVVIGVLLALLWVFALRRWYRQAPTPLESVEHQQRALDALQHAASRARTRPGSDRANAADVIPSRVPRDFRAPRSFAPIAVALVGTLVLAGVGAIWWVGRSPNDKQSATPATTAKHRRTAATSSTSTTTSTTTTTTAPPPALATITSASSSTVAVTVSQPSFTVAIDATAPCWVRAQPSQPGTNPLFQRTLQAGETQPIPVTGGLDLRLGAANNVTLTVDGQPLALPKQTGQVLSVTFTGSSNGA